MHNKKYSTILGWERILSSSEFLYISMYMYAPQHSYTQNAVAESSEQ